MNNIAARMNFDPKEFVRSLTLKDAQELKALLNSKMSRIVEAADGITAEQGTMIINKSKFEVIDQVKRLKNDANIAFFRWQGGVGGGYGFTAEPDLPPVDGFKAGDGA